MLSRLKDMLQRSAELCLQVVQPARFHRIAEQHCDVRMTCKGDPVGVVLTLYPSSATLESRTPCGSRVGRLQEQ